MKNKTVSFYLIIFSLFILYSCETTEALEFEENNIELIIENRSSSDNTLDIEATKVISEIKKNASSKSSNILDEINFENYKYIEYDNYHSYTFSFKNNSQTVFKNLILTLRNDNSYDVYLIEYYPTEAQYTTLLNRELLESDIPSSVVKLDIDTGEFLGNLQRSCTVSVHTIGHSCVAVPACSYGGNDHPAGANCTEVDGTITVCTPISQIAVTGCDGSSGSDGGGAGGDGGGTGGGGSGGSGVIPHPDVANPEPTVPCDSSNENQVFDNGNGSCVGPTTTPVLLELFTATTLSNLLEAQADPNDSFVIDSSIDPDDALTFSSVEEFTLFRQSYQLDSDFPIEIDQHGNRVASLRIDIGLHNIDVFLSQSVDLNNPENYQFLGVSSQLSGLTVGRTWHQNDEIEVAIIENEVIVTINGTLNTNLFIESIGTIYSDTLTIEVHLSKLTGEILSSFFIEN